jgi:hypothetical protein
MVNRLERKLQKHQIKNIREIKEIEDKAFRCPEFMLAYLAGYFDGEGSITVNGRKRFDRKGKELTIREKIPVINIKIGTTDRDVLDLFEKYFGGKTYKSNRRTKTGNTVYSYRANVNTTKVILRFIYPYLTIKKKQAAITMEMFRKSDIVPWKEFMPEKIRLLRKIRSFNKKIGDMAVEILD